MAGLPTIIDCEGCGACCRHMGYPPYLDGDDGTEAEPAWTAMPAELKSELLAYASLYKSPTSGLDGPCLWFDPHSKTCRHHEHRPKVCRDFGVDSQDCRDWRRVYGIAECD